MSKKSSEQEDPILSQSKEIIESYIFSSSSRRFSVYSERLLMRLVEAAQRQVEGLNFRDGEDIGQVSIGPLGEARLEIPISNLLGTGNTNYSKAKESIIELMRSPYFIERPKMRAGKPVLDENGAQQYELIGSQILNDCQVNVVPGMAQITVNENTWKAILDFSKGFRRFDLNAAMKLTRVSATRMFRLLSNLSDPVTYSIEDLRSLLGYDEIDPSTGTFAHYPETKEFIRKVIDSAKEEMDEKCPWSFSYVKNKAAGASVNQGRRGPKTVTSITFYPERRVGKMSTQTLVRMAGISVKSLIGQEAYDMLVNKFLFTPQGLKANVMTFEAVSKCGMDLPEFLVRIAPNALRASNIPGYVIRSIDRHLQEYYSVAHDREGYHFPVS